MGDFMSAMNGMSQQIQAIRALTAIDAHDVHVVDVTAVFPGNNQRAITRAINRAFFTDLHALIAEKPELAAALEEADIQVEDVIAIRRLDGGQIVLFHAGLG
ncbi:MAG: hypothetical protein AB7X49_00555 [Geminicoccaceae bacterium]